jgi:pimeloyl-ACP methyl ester carboxylesterase
MQRMIGSETASIGLKNWWVILNSNFHMVTGWCAKCLAIASIVTMLGGPVFAQRNQSAAKKTAAESVKLKTKDGVELHCSFYEGKASTQTVPVMLVHGLDGQAGEWASTAKKLQAAGFSVIVPDLRAHGQSTKQTSPDGSKERQLRAERLRGDDYKKFVTMDLEAVKKFLVKKHNDEELNIDMLTIVGSEFGAIVSSLWTAQDWSWPLVAGQKQGQDVKALVLLSPPPAFKGMSVLPATKSRAFQNIAIFVAYGKDGKRGNETKRLCKTIEKSQKNVSEPRVFEWAIPTKLQGVKLLQESKLGVAGSIVKFIKAQVVDRAEDYPYKSR